MSTSEKIRRFFKVAGEWVIDVLALSRRKTETRTVFWSRVAILYVIRLGLLGYIILMATEVAEKNIAVTVDRKELDETLVPNIYIGVYNNKGGSIPEFNCTIFNATGRQQLALDANITEPCTMENVTATSSNTQWYKFDSKRRSFKNPYRISYNETYLAYVEIDYSISSNDSILIIASAFHPDSDLYNPRIFAEFEAVGYASDLMGRLERDFFTLSNNRLNLMRSTTHQVKKFKSTAISTFSGYLTDSKEFRYITTTMTTANVPLLEGNASAVLILLPQDFILDDETEKPDRTVLDLLNDVGGMAGLVFAILVFLFGGDTAGPWGVVQMCVCRSRVKKKLRRELGGCTFNNNEENIKERLDALENFLEEYVVDTSLLKTRKTVEELHKYANHQNV